MGFQPQPLCGNHQVHGKQGGILEGKEVTRSSNGYWFLDLVNFRTKDHGAVYSYVCGSARILIETQGGNEGITEMVTDAVDFSEGERPGMLLAAPESPVSNYTVSFTAGPGGSLTGKTTQVVPHGGDCNAVTAHPDACYEFTQ